MCKTVSYRIFSGLFNATFNLEKYSQVLFIQYETVFIYINTRCDTPEHRENMSQDMQDQSNINSAVCVCVRESIQLSN